MKTKRIRRSDEDVILCGKLVAKGLTVISIERVIGIPHSTVHWIVLNRLPKLDGDLYMECKSIFRLHKSKVGILNDWTA